MEENHVNVVDSLAAHRLVPVVVIDDAAHAGPLAKVLVAGGLPVAEVTFRTSAAVDAIARMSEAEPDLLVGAGTVTSPEQVDRAVDAGARFVVSPGFSAEVVLRCAERGVFALPGAATATEVMAALAAGVRVVKFFPAATSGGPSAVAALAAPFGDVRFVPTGGITADNAAEYLAIPSVLAVGGSWMVPRQMVAAGDVGQIRDLVATSVAALP
jgi:2-dehydro-3-deoxyphosphogluconate aldolase / (4S)-4-hydroxy-2-oxoglutarate aldolase